MSLLQRALANDAAPRWDPQRQQDDVRKTLFDLLAYQNWWDAYDAKQAADAEFKESDHPRDESGEFTAGSGGGASSETSAKSSETSAKPRLVPLKSGATLPAHIASLKIPPAWTDVHYAPDAGAHLLVTGRDAKNRMTAIYAESFNAKQAAAKFARVSELDQKFDAIAKQNEAAKKDPAKRDVADALDLVMKMGVRPGSESDTKADFESFGATTLEGRHVRVSPNGNVRLQFVPGKHRGKEVLLPVEDAKLAAMLTKRKQKAGNSGRLFGNVTHAALLAHTHDMDGGGFKTKDFRTHLGTKTATSEVAGRDAPTNPTQYKKAVREVATVVANRLGNTPTIALASYIAPQVFASWRAAAGV